MDAKRQAVEAALADARFPTTKGELVEATGGRPVGGAGLTVADLLVNLHDKAQLKRRRDAVDAAVAQWRELTG